MQDRCPLCHDILYKVESDVQNENIDFTEQREVEEDENERRPEDLLLIHPLPADHLVR